MAAAGKTAGSRAILAVASLRTRLWPIVSLYAHRKP